MEENFPQRQLPAPDFPSHPFPPALVTPFPLLSQSLADSTSKIPGRSLISMRTEPNFSLWSCWDAPASPTKWQNQTRRTQLPRKEKANPSGKAGMASKSPWDLRGAWDGVGSAGSSCARISSTSLPGAGRANTSAGEAGRAASAPGGWKPREAAWDEGQTQEASTAEVLGAGKGVGAGNAQPSSWTRNESRPCEHHMGQGVGIREKHGLEILHGTSSV